MLATTELAPLLASAAGGEVTSVRRLAGLDEQVERDSIDAVGALPPGTAVVLVVEAWELPVGEYLDFIAALRNAGGGERLLVVLLSNTWAPERNSLSRQA